MEKFGYQIELRRLATRQREPHGESRLRYDSNREAMGALWHFACWRGLLQQFGGEEIRYRPMSWQRLAIQQHFLRPYRMVSSQDHRLHVATGLLDQRLQRSRLRQNHPLVGQGGA